MAPVPPAGSNMAEDYDWDQSWYHYDYPADYEDLSEYSLRQKEERYIRNLKIMSFLVLTLAFSGIWVFLPIVNTVFKKIMFLVGVLFLGGVQNFIVVACGKVKLACCGPCIYGWAWIKCRRNGWGNDLDYYFLVKYCEKNKTEPPEYDDYLEYKKSIPDKGRKLTWDLLF